MKPVSIKTPTFEQYQQIYSTHSQTLICPCTHISVNYQHFLRIDYTLHQVCHSLYVSQEWIEYLYYSYDNNRIFLEDFRKSGTHSFQALRSLCQLINRTISESLIQLSRNAYVSTSVTALDLFESQIRTFIDQFRSSTTNSFLLSFDLIRSTTHSNTLLSALTTNYEFLFPSNSSTILLSSQSYSNCTCELEATCMKSSSIYNYSNKSLFFSIPGFYYGCYITEALLQSTLECFFNQTCIDELQSYINSTQSINITALNQTQSSQYSPKTTIQQLLNSLLIEQWHVSTLYEVYYQQCQPTECIYTYVATSNTIYIATTLLALFGGLITFLKIIVPILSKVTQWINRRSRRRERLRRIGIAPET